MGRLPQLLDRWGHPVIRSTLKTEVAAATIGGVRSPISGTPADGLNPVRLASLLREADGGDPLRYLELAEVIEERDPHYLGVLSTRKRSVSQIEVSVEAASDDSRDVEMADMIRDWLKRDELTDEIFDILDCLGKGYSFTEIIWDTSTGQWMPLRLEWRDPRWFRFDRNDLATPMQLDDQGREQPLAPFKFIYATIKAKSGLALRAGLARVAAWGWMFKAYTQRDWAIFTQTYGQPLRVGKYGAGASEKDRDTLFTAVANIAGDCAAIIPESMTIDFVETSNVGASSTLYRERADWLDQQISKAILGQTSTTDAVIGGLGSGKEHRAVQEDIERADARSLAAILNRDLIRPWVELNYGPQARYPRLIIARPEAEDLTRLATALAALVPLGLRVSQSEIRDKFGLADPATDDDVLRLAPVVPPATAPVGDPANLNPIIKRVSGEIKRGGPVPGPQTALNAEGPSAVKFEALSETDLLTDRLAREARPAVAGMLGQIEAMLGAAGSLEELREMLMAGFPDVDATALSDLLAQAMLAAHTGGRAMLEEESRG
jgi:phage gp29-like protein